MMARSAVTISGIGPLKRNLERLGDKAPKVLGKGLKREAEGVIEMAIPLTPKRTGDLRASAAVSRIKRKRSEGTIEVDAGFGSRRAWYALIVHERTELRHRAPTRAKFLEGPFNARTRSTLGRLARFIRLQVLRHLRVTG